MLTTSVYRAHEWPGKGATPAVRRLVRGPHRRIPVRSGVASRRWEGGVRRCKETSQQIMLIRHHVVVAKSRAPPSPRLPRLAVVAAWRAWWGRGDTACELLPAPPGKNRPRCREKSSQFSRNRRALSRRRAAAAPLGTPSPAACRGADARPGRRDACLLPFYSEPSGRMASPWASPRVLRRQENHVCSKCPRYYNVKWLSR